MGTVPFLLNQLRPLDKGGAALTQAAASIALRFLKRADRAAGTAHGDSPGACGAPPRHTPGHAI